MQSQFEQKNEISFVISRTNYHFKMCLSLASLGMSSIIKEDVRVLELWIDGHQEKYRLEAKNKKLKEDFAVELKKGILKAKENPSSSRVARQPQAVQVTDGEIIYYGVDILLNFQEENITSNSDSEPRKEGQRPSFNRSKSLDHQVQRKLSRQESAETDGGYGGGGGERISRRNGQSSHSKPFR